MKQKPFLLMSVFGASLLTVVAVAGIDTDASSLAAAEAPWIHYSAIDPTASEPGIKEFYVNCASHEHKLNKPSSQVTEGVWDSSKKEAIQSNQDDDRFIKSFYQLDSMIDGYEGDGPFDYTRIKEAKNYYDANYSSTAKTQYVSSSNAIFEAKENYDSLYGVIFNAQTVHCTQSSSSGVFTYSQEEDPLYGGVTSIEFLVDVTPGSSYQFKDIAWYAEDGGYLNPVSATNKTISFAIYASEACGFNIVAVYDDAWAQNLIFKKNLQAGWNEYTFDSNDDLYRYLTNAETLRCLQLQIRDQHSSGSIIKVTSFIGKSAVIEVEKMINALPSVSDIGPKDYDNINLAMKAYKSLSDHDKGLVSNYSKLNGVYREWNSKYLVIYDVTESYAGFSTFGGGSMTQSLTYDEEYGYAKTVTVTEGFQALFLSNYKKAYTTTALSEIVYYVKPSRDTYMSWRDNYGRRAGDPIMSGGQWNRYSVSGTLTVSGEEVDTVSAFMDMFQNGSYSVINMTGASDRWHDYCLGDVGYTFQMTSLVGVKKLSEVGELNRKIASLPEVGSISLDCCSLLNEIEDGYESLDTLEKVAVVGMDRYYEAKSEFNRRFNYIFDPYVDISSWQEPSNLSGHEYGVSGPYGPSYVFHCTKNTGVTMLLKPTTLSSEASSAKLYFKNYKNKLDIAIGSYTDVVVSKTSGTPVGDDWYEYSFTKSEINAILGYQNTTSKVVYYMVPGSNNTPFLAGNDYYISGLFGFNDISYDGSAVALAQSKIDALPEESALTPFSNIAITEAQDAVYSLSSAGQVAIDGGEKLTNLYSAYKERYEYAYSLDVYRHGLVWYSCGENVTPGLDGTYGRITSFDSQASKTAEISLGSWIKADNYTTNSYSGQGRPLSPLEHGKYSHVYFAVYSPLSEKAIMHVYACQEKGGGNSGIESFNIYPGWNTLSFQDSSIEKLSGYFNGTYKDFQGLDFVFPNLSYASTGWKLTGLIGEKNTSYVGDSKEHFAEGTLHQNTKNIQASSTPLFEAGSSTYKFVYTQGGIADEAVSFLKKTINEKAGVVPSFVEHSSFGADGRYIYIGYADEMESAGVALPDKEAIGETGYLIKTVGSSVFIYAYGESGYKMAILKFLEASVGYEWLSHDLSVAQKNGSMVSDNATFYLPLFNVLERPDYDTRVFSNTTRMTDPNGIYGSGLDGYKYYLTDDGNGNRIGDMIDYLPYDSYSDMYYSDSKGKVFCYSCKGSASRLEEAIQIVGDKIISGAIAHPEIDYAAAFQIDSGTHCNCSGCRALYGSDEYMYASVVVTFMNKLDNYIRANYTERTIKLLFLAYGFNYTLKVPTNVSCNKNVIPYVAPTRARWCYSFYDDHNSTGAGETDSNGNVYSYDNDYAGLVEAWANYADEIAIWAYQTSFGSSLLIYDNFEALIGQYRFFYNSGARFMQNEGNWVDNASGFIALKDYIDSKALNDVNVSYDEIYSQFFSMYYGNGGEAMRDLFDEACNNFQYCLDRYGRDNTYNPDSSPVKSGSSYYFDGRLEINASYDYEIFWGDDGKNNSHIDVYNGQQNLGATNIANINKWMTYIETALASETRDVYQKHIKNDALFVYMLAYNYKGRTDLAETIVDTSFEVGTYWRQEFGPRNDSYNWKDGTHTICYEFTGQTYRERYSL